MKRIMCKFQPSALTTGCVSADAPTGNAVAAARILNGPSCWLPLTRHIQSDRKTTMRAFSDSSLGDCIAPGSLGGQPTGVEASSAKGLAAHRLDQLLLQSIAAGDKSAMRVLYQRYNVRIYRFILRRVGNSALAEDIASEVFLEVWRSAGRFKAESQVATWLLAIARHKAISALRRRSEVQLDDHMAAVVEDPRDDPETHAGHKDRCEIIQKCLNRLSPHHREIIDLVYYHERTVREAAQILGVPEGTAKTRIFHARKHMSKLLTTAGIHGAC
jgi:RNA polymerase sigma-70 factor, ECF subfamily